MTLLRHCLLRVWLTIAVVDAICASALHILAYKSTFARLWQGVAATVLGPSSFDGGTRTVLVGLLLHLGVALAWSTVFLALYLAWPSLRRAITTPAGALGVAAIYGPVIWLVMSCVVIPLATGRAPTFAFRWWVQVVAHIPFVAIPIVFSTRKCAESRTV